MGTSCVCHASGNVLSSRSCYVLSCNLFGRSLRNSEALRPAGTSASDSLSAAGFSGRISSPPTPRLERTSDYGASTFARSFRRRVGYTSEESFFTASEYFLLSILPLTSPRSRVKIFQSRSSSLRQSGDQPFDVRLNYVGGRLQTSSENCLSVATVGSGDVRALDVPMVSTPPSNDMHSERIYYTSESLVGGKEVDDMIDDLPSDLQRELMPRHVAIVMDGNARWAKRRGLHMSLGHAAGAEALKQVVRVASRWGVEALTVFAFSTENWQRPQMEVDFLMHLFETKLQSEMATVMKNNLQLRFVGDTLVLPLSLQTAIESAKDCTRDNDGMIINICVSYSGRADLVRACRQLATQVVEGSLNPEDIDDAALAEKLFMSELGTLQDPDLVIRTSGEHRISNFLLWQAAYSEFVFSDVLWPDFGREDLRAALVKFQQRDRRYGTRYT